MSTNSDTSPQEQIDHLEGEVERLQTALNKVQTQRALLRRAARCAIKGTRWLGRKLVVGIDLDEAFHAWMKARTDRDPLPAAETARVAASVVRRVVSVRWTRMLLFAISGLLGASLLIWQNWEIRKQSGLFREQVQRQSIQHDQSLQQQIRDVTIARRAQLLATIYDCAEEQDTEELRGDPGICSPRAHPRARAEAVRVLAEIDGQADLSRADLSGVVLAGVTLDKAQLAEANLYGTNLRLASLVRADLLRADLRGADLFGVDLRDARLFRADLSVVDLKQADLRDADFTFANLRWAELTRIKADSANFGGTNLSWAELNGADLAGASLSGANLRGAVLIGANLQGADLGNVQLSLTALGHADLRDADLFGAEIDDRGVSDWEHTEANEIEAIFEDRALGSRFVQPERLTFLHLGKFRELRGASFGGANLRGADLRDANLVHAVGLTQDQIDSAIGNSETQLPPSLTRPGHWEQQ